MAMIDITDVAMRFVRCRGGISHHPDEHVEPADADAGARVLLRLIENFRPKGAAEQKIAMHLAELCARRDEWRSPGEIHPMLAGPGRALLFDIDGTLADTDALHVEAFNQVFGPRGHVFDRARAAKELMGFSTASLAERFLADEPPEHQAAIMDEKEALFRRLVAGRVQPMPGLMTLLAFADRAGIPMVAVTNAPRLNAEMLISGLGVMDRFKAIVIGDELAHGKPHPLPYLEGLRAVNADAGLSVAFEDSRSGIASASAAGIATVGVRSSLGHAELIAAGARLTVASFDDSDLMKMIAATMGW